MPTLQQSLAAFVPEVEATLNNPPLGTVSHGPAPLGPFQPAPLSQATRDNFFEQANISPTSDLGQILAEEFARNPNISATALIDLANQFRQQQQFEAFVEQLQADQAAGRTAQLAGLDEFESATRQRTDRLRRVLEPGGLSNDAEFANILAQAEAPLQGVLRDTRAAASNQLGGAGVRRAGKATTRVRNAEIGVQGQRGRIRSGVLGDVRNQLTGFEDTLSRIPLARGEIEAGQFPLSLQAGQFAAGAPQPDVFGSTTGTRFDIEAAQQGLGQQQFGNALQLASLLIGAGQNAGQQGLQFIDSVRGN